MLFDEPTSAPRPPNWSEKSWPLSSVIAAQGMTMLVVTHEIGFAREGVADRVVFMDDGYVVEEGSASTVIDNPQMQRTRTFLSRMS